MNLLVIFILPVIIVGITAYGLVKRVKIYEEFVVGAKDGFDIAVRIIPYLVAILFAIGMFRASGAMDWMILGLKPVLGFFGFPAEVLPMAIIRPPHRERICWRPGRYDRNVWRRLHLCENGWNHVRINRNYVLCNCRLFWSRWRQKN